MLKLSKPMPSFLDPAPKRFLTNGERPLSIRQTTEMAVRRGKGYCGILHEVVSVRGEASVIGKVAIPFPEEYGCKLTNGLGRRLRLVFLEAYHYPEVLSTLVVEGSTEVQTLQERDNRDISRVERTRLHH